jgi:O-antigen ligase
VQDNWLFGVGIGDAEEAISSAYEESGFVVGSRNDFNAHNQYLQTWLSAGLPGLLALLFVLAALTWHAIRNRDVVLAMVAWYFFLSMLTESMLVRNWAGSLFATVLFVIALASRPRDRDADSHPEPVTTP